MNASSDTPSSKLAPQPGPLGSAAEEEALGIARILVPTDFSEESKPAIRYATRLARRFGASIHLATVIDSLDGLKGAEVVPWKASMDDAILILKRKLTELATEEIGELVPVYPHVVWGHAFDEIVSLARAFFCDLIILSTHGRTGASRAIIGSVAEKVVRHAHCPVLVVRTRERDLPEQTALNHERTNNALKEQI